MNPNHPLYQAQPAGGFAAMVKYINQSAAKVVSIDIPSGLMCEDNTYNIHILEVSLSVFIGRQAGMNCSLVLLRLEIIPLVL